MMVSARSGADRSSALMGLLLVALALPAFGGGSYTKIYSLNMAPATTSVAGTSAALTATFKNETPDGNSSINSLVLTAPSGLAITGATIPNGTVAIASGGGSVTVTNMYPVKNGKSVTMNLSVTTSASCTTAGGNWSAVTWTGSSLSGTQFALVPAHSSRSTLITSGGCTYSLNVAPSSFLAGTSPSVTATFKNLASVGGPAITALALAAPANLKITGVTSSTCGGTSGFTSTSVNITGTGLAANAECGITLAVDTSCSASAASWGSTASAGSNAITLATASSSLGSAVTGACSLAFTTQPRNGVAGAPLSPNVQVSLLGGGGLPVPGATQQVSVALSGNFVGSPSTLPTIGGTATFQNLTFATSGGPYQLVASAPGYGPISSQSFTIYDGNLTCPSAPSPGATTTFTQSSGANTTNGNRLENKDGGLCVPVGFDVTFSDQDRTVALTWDQSAQPFAVLETDTTWPRELVDPATGLPKPTNVAWELVSGAPVYVPGPACLSSAAPAPFGTLGVAVTDTVGTTLTITPTTSLPTPPFPVVIASNVAGVAPERMLVTALAGNTATVVRGSGGTAASTHSAGAPVMSTPLPVFDPNAKLPAGSTTTHPYAGKQAPVCIIEEDFLAQPFAAAGCPAQAAGVEPLGCVLVETRLFVLGDPFVSRK